MPEPTSQILIYQPEDGKTRIDVRLEDETVWLTQGQMVELFQTTKPNISIHIRNIFQERELDETSVVKEYLTTAADGKNYRTKHYNLDVIIAVGYRVRSHRGTQFRRWATERLREYLVKGFALDDERLKEGRNLGADYFDELLDRIRDIRASEKRFYRKITEIYAPVRRLRPQCGNHPRVLRHRPKQTPLGHPRPHRRRTHHRTGRRRQAQHGAHGLERRQGPQRRCHRC